MIGKMKAFFEFEIFESRIFGGEGGGLENWWLDLSVGFFILLFIYLFYLFIFWGGVLGGGGQNNLECLQAFNFYCLPFVVIYRIL